MPSPSEPAGGARLLPTVTEAASGDGHGNYHSPAEHWGPSVLLPVAAGSVIVFNSLIPHQSEANTSDADRRALLAVGETVILMTTPVCPY